MLVTYPLLFLHLSCCWCCCWWCCCQRLFAVHSVGHITLAVLTKVVAVVLLLLLLFPTTFWCTYTGTRHKSEDGVKKNWLSLHQSDHKSCRAIVLNLPFYFETKRISILLVNTDFIYNAVIIWPRLYNIYLVPKLGLYLSGMGEISRGG